MYHWVGKLAKSFLRATLPAAEESALSKDMHVNVHDMTQLLKPFIKPRDLNRYAHSKNGLQIATLDIVIAVREAMREEHYLRYESLQGSLIMLEACLTPDANGMITIPRQSLRELRSNRQVVEDAAQMLRKQGSTINDSVSLTRGRLSHYLIDEMTKEVIDREQTADAIIKLADNFAIFFNNHNPDLPQEPKQTSPVPRPALRSPRLKFLGGVPRK